MATKCYSNLAYFTKSLSQCVGGTLLRSSSLFPAVFWSCSQCMWSNFGRHAKTLLLGRCVCCVRVVAKEAMRFWRWGWSRKLKGRIRFLFDGGGLRNPPYFSCFCNLYCFSITWFSSFARLVRWWFVGYLKMEIHVSKRFLHLLIRLNNQLSRHDFSVDWCFQFILKLLVIHTFNRCQIKKK